MNSNDFWQIVDDSLSEGDRDQQQAKLGRSIQMMSLAEYEAFIGHFGEACHALVKDDAVVNAAWCVNEQSLSRDVLDYFCFWLISLGKAGCEEVRAAPDIIIDLLHVNKDPNFEEFGEAMYGRGDELPPSTQASKHPCINERIWSASLLKERLPRLYAYSL